MKTKRFVSTLLALLLVCSLPVSAFAADDNLPGTTVPEVSTGDTMGTNSGTVTTNNGTVDNNGRIVETNNGYISVNEGEVKTNNGTVNINAGNVRINNTTGIVNNDVGVVFTNYGTVNTLEYDSSVNDWVITETWYGVQVDNDGKTTLEQKKAGEVLDLTQFTKEGYVYAGYTQEYQLLNGVLTKQALTVSDTSYTVTCPNVLTLIWQAIVNPGSGSGSGSGSGENASAAGETAADDGAGSFGPGSFVSINGHKFLLVAVVKDVY